MDNIKAIGEYIILSKLGSGSYGVVSKVKKINDHNIYVIKQIPLDNLTSKQIYEVKQEAKILASINSIYVVRYYDSFEENNSLNIVMEYCDGGDLSKFLDENKKTKILLKENLVWNLFLKIAIGLASIHNLKILHRDLKTLNIFLTKDLDVKIGDLGVAKMLTHTKFAKTFIGTPYYLSPELCQDIPYNDKSDVWALGCILYELCTYKHPFNAKNQGALIIKILKDTPSPIHNYYSNELQDLIYSLLEKDEKLRPSCYDILVTPFILDKAKQLGLYNEIVNLYPHIINNNMNYGYYNSNEDQYIYENDNNMYEDYSHEFINKSMYESNINNINNFNDKYYYSGFQGDKNGNYYINNYGQNNNMFSEYNNIYINGNNNRKRMVNSNSEGYFKNIIYIKKKNSNNNGIIKNKKINKENKISSFYNNNSDIYNGQKIHINPMFRKHKSDLNDNYDNKINIEKRKNNSNHKIIYFDYKNGKKYIKKPIKSNGIEELFRNNSNGNLKKRNINIEFNNRKKNNSKNEIQEINNNNQINKQVNNNEKNKGKKNLNEITEFANILNNYVEQHNAQNKNSNFQNCVNETEPNSEESPKDNLRKKNKKNIIFDNSDFKIINNNEENTQKNEKECSNNIKSISSLTSNDYEYSLTTSNNISKINSIKINSILQNHKNLKILKNIDKNDKEENNLNSSNNNEKEKEKDKDKEFEENLYSSEEEKDGNIYDSEEESDDGQSEKVKEIVEKKGRDSSMTKSMIFLTNDEIKKKLINERDSLKEKVENYKSDILKLIGEEDYNYIINMYSKVNNYLGGVNEIYQKFEEYFKDKYQEEKKENLKNLYSSFICLDCQLSKKEQHLKKYL